MKILCLLSLIVCITQQSSGDDLTAVQQFNKVTDPAARARLIAQAPPDEKAIFQKLDLIHKELLRRWGGEERLKRLRESQVARARGLGALEDVFHAQVNFWEGYIGGVLGADRKAGVSINKQQQDEVHLSGEEDLVRKRVSSVHTLVFNLAPTPKALELVKKAKLLDRQLTMRQTEDSVTPHRPPITKQELEDSDKQLDLIYAELQELPKLTPDQAQKELDAFTDDKVQPW
jgi:hypothetical protein